MDLNVVSGYVRAWQLQQEILNACRMLSGFCFEGKMLEMQTALLSEREVPEVERERIWLDEMHFGCQAQVLQMQMLGAEDTLLGSLPFGGVGGGRYVETQLAAPHHQRTNGEVEWGRGRVLLRESIHDELEIEGLVAVLVYLGLRADELGSADAYFLLNEGQQIDFRSDSRGLKHQGVTPVVELHIVQNGVSQHVQPQFANADLALHLVRQNSRRSTRTPTLEGGQGR